MGRPSATCAALAYNRMIHFYFLALLFSPCCVAPVSETFTVSVKSPVSVQRGHTAILPCWLTSSQNAEDMEVRWYQGSDEYDTPALLYKEKAFDYSSQKASFAGRVSFGLKEETSGGLQAGDVSLKLEKATIEDIGTYTCYVSSSVAYSSASVSLTVTETGRSPLLSAVMKDDNKVNLSCQSDGWYPKPELSWSDNKTALTPANVMFSRISAGFYSVHSWVLVSSPSEVSCSVGLSNEEPKEARMRLENPSSLQEESGSSAGWVAFGTLLVFMLAAFGALYFLYYRKKGNKSGNDTTDGANLTNIPEENEPLLSKALLEASNHYVNVQLVDTGNPLIKMKNSILRDNADAEFPDGDRVTCLTAVRGSPGFSSGRHYWEVSLEFFDNEQKMTLIKKSWWIGVTDKHEIPHDERLSPTTKNGFWFLSSCPNQEDTLQFSTEPETFIYVQSKPKTVGVYLDFDNRKLSFYNVEEKCLIGSLAAEFTGELFPLFNPGKGDVGTMKILQRPVQNQSINT
ncbi:butyrophilin subfamily 3 member A3-like isoform X2 [Poecilia formosa]|uniref:butyrophilin subfamily 3 member A3-like isoform X2 n=1 Tax=Poecilia formosa TaxID=48698 RepID=UPI0007BA2ECE|nr:PREDICTED: butyrophilin subfamily 3 member A3-like isoform X2 [Poecilia formosa]